MAQENSTQQDHKKMISELEKAQSFSRMVYDQFKRNKAALFGAYTILFFVLIAVGAPIISYVTGLDPSTVNAINRYKPPMSRITVSSDVKESKLKAFIENHPADKIEILKNQLIEKQIVSPPTPEDALYEWITLAPSEALASLEKIDTDLKSDLKKMFNSYEKLHVLGTDDLGRDVLMRLIYGTQVSMGVGILATLASAFVGLIFGSLSGYYGGIMDTILMRITDSMMALPILPVLVVIAAIDLKKVPLLEKIAQGGNESIIKLIFILCIFSWMPVARLVRGSIMSLREREFILASKTLGASDSTIIVRHMFPNVIGPMLVSITLGVGQLILFEAALSFLGLGIQPPTPSWGNMLFNAQELIYQAPYLAIFPGMLIFLVVVSFNFFGDGLQDAVDPKSVRR
jgi:peptide/nickel transport system permease protein